jgi:hypothetical protein
MVGDESDIPPDSTTRGREERERHRSHQVHQPFRVESTETPRRSSVVWFGMIHSAPRDTASVLNQRHSVAPLTGRMTPGWYPPKCEADGERPPRRSAPHRRDLYSNFMRNAASRPEAVPRGRQRRLERIRLRHLPDDPAASGRGRCHRGVSLPRSENERKTRAGKACPYNPKAPGSRHRARVMIRHRICEPQYSTPGTNWMGSRSCPLAFFQNPGTYTAVRSRSSCKISACSRAAVSRHLFSHPPLGGTSTSREGYASTKPATTLRAAILMASVVVRHADGGGRST